MWSVPSFRHPNFFGPVSSLATRDIENLAENAINEVIVYSFVICKGRHFSLLRHFQHRIKHRSRHVNQTNHANPFPTISTPGFLPNECKYTSRISHCSVTLSFIDIGQHMSKHPFSQCNLVSRKHALRSIPNLDH